MANEGVQIWFNPRCSKCRGADELLMAYGVAAEKIDYLDDPPPREELVRVLRLLGAEDPRAMMRTQERLYTELDLEDADDETLIDAMAQYPELIERPIVIRADEAVVARPPELLLSLLDPASAPVTPAPPQ
jgi:arsenate reductase